MFRASLCPSSGALGYILLHMVFSTYREAGRAHCAHGLLPDSTRHQPAYKVPKIICSKIQPSAPEDGHNEARNMLS